MFKRKLAALICLTLLFTTVMSPVSTAWAAKASYHTGEFGQLREFLAQNGNGKKVSKNFVVNDPATYGVKTTVSGGKIRVKSISWSNKDLSGTLDLSGFSQLTYLNVSNNDLTKLNLTGCSKLSTLKCNSNKLTEIKGLKKLTRLKAYSGSSMATDLRHNKLSDAYLTSSKLPSSLYKNSNWIKQQKGQKITVSVKSVSMDGSKKTITAGKKFTIEAKVSPQNATNKTLKWYSSNSSVASVDSKGVVTAKKKGTATITAKSSNGKKDTYKVTVKAPSVQEVNLDKDKLSIVKGKSASLKALFSPSGSSSSLKWSSSNSSIASVNSKGVVTGKKAGTAVITVKTSNGKAARCTVTVKNNQMVREEPKHGSKGKVCVSGHMLYYKGGYLMMEVFIYNNTNKVVSGVEDVALYLEKADGSRQKVMSIDKIDLSNKKLKHGHWTIKTYRVPVKKVGSKLDLSKCDVIGVVK
jgi:uncharacterized protein YjdB